MKALEGMKITFIQRKFFIQKNLADKLAVIAANNVGTILAHREMTQFRAERIPDALGDFTERITKFTREARPSTQRGSRNQKANRTTEARRHGVYTEKALGNKDKTKSNPKA
jgi:hypothetical protein